MERRRSGTDVKIRMAAWAQSVHSGATRKLAVQQQRAAMSTTSSGIIGRCSEQVAKVAKVWGVAKRSMVNHDATLGTGRNSQGAHAQIKNKRGSIRERPE